MSVRLEFPSNGIVLNLHYERKGDLELAGIYVMVDADKDIGSSEEGVPPVRHSAGIV